MNPIDALPQDCRMYYHNCWMRHETKGIGYVTVDGASFMFYEFPNDKAETSPVKVKPDQLTCWWPRAGAYNTPNGAIYISRKAIRTMRKSAVPQEHYDVKYGRVRSSYEIMLVMRRGPDHHNMDFALNVLKQGLSNSVAITRDIILAKGPFDEITVIFRGLEAGEYRDGEFIPTFNGSPLAKRVMYKLAAEELR